MKKYLWVIAGFALHKLFGLGGVLAFLYFAWLFKWGQAHPRWRWASLAASFFVGLIGFVASGLYFHINDVDSEDASKLGMIDVLGVMSVTFSTGMIVGSVLMAAFHGYLSVRGSRHRKDVVQVFEPDDSLPRNVHPEDLPEGQPSGAPTGLSS